MQQRSFWKHRVDSDASSPASQAGRQPVMGPCSEDPHLCGASRLLGFTSLLLSVCCTGVKSSVAPDPGVQDSGVHIPLQGIRGGSVLFHVPKKQEAEPEEVSWGFGPESNYRVFMRVHRGKDTPTWVSLQDKYQQRVHVPNVTSLRIENLIPEDSGQYRARASFIGGIEFTQVFRLTVYDPAPLPHILVKSASFTAGWCNATLKCTAPGDTEDLKVTWEIKGLPKELEQRVTSKLPSNSWNLTLNLPLSQPNGSLTCVVSNQVGQKTATLDLGEVCVSGVEFQDDQRDNDGGVQYAELNQQGSGEVTNKGTLPWSGSHSTSAASSVDAAIPARLGQVWVTLVMTLVPATVSSGVRSLYADLSYSELRHSLAYGPSQHLISLIGTLENIRTSPT
ncbi:hypothetical protein MG293_001171 [Ovis ammon polii]|uniref:Ig-like domain-containing protein n=1 Tax=Ovis ammon polii TaxID=230172 RepID=A0AAD4UML1_OVIAM|nr:hypothetical protein MG293_001171 [Ovis ammon polii]